MLALVGIMDALSPEDQVLLAHDVFNTWGKHGKHVLSHVVKHVDLNGKHVAKTRVNAAGEPSRRGEVASRRDSSKDVDSLDILAFLNLKTGRSYRPVEENLRFIRARLNTCSVEDMKGVIARKTREWHGTSQQVFLRPKTLFSATNFEQYIGEQPHA